MYKITKEFSFCASHQLTGLPKEHPCSRLHGHNYVVKVELKSETLNEVGFIVDYREMEPIKKMFDLNYDHRHLNNVLSFNPTAENMSKHFFELIKSEGFPVSAVEVSETPKTNARYEEA